MTHPLDARIAELERELRALRYQRACDNKRAAGRARWSDPAVRAAMSVKLRAAQARPEVRARHAAAMSDPAVKAKMAEHCRRLNKDPVINAKRSLTRKANAAARRAAQDEPKHVRKRAGASALASVPRDPIEVELFGGAR